MTGIIITTTENVAWRSIDPVVEIMLNNGVLRVDNGLHIYEFDYSLITKIEFCEVEDK